MKKEERKRRSVKREDRIGRDRTEMCEEEERKRKRTGYDSIGQRRCVKRRGKG